MKKNIHLLVPMSGQGTRYQKAGYKDPKPLIPVNGIPMIARLLEKVPTQWMCTFVLAENHRTTELENSLKKLRPHSQILYVPQHNQGPSYPLQQSIAHLPENDAILVSYCDYGLVWDPWHFQDFVSYTDCDACLISYKGFHAHYLSPVPYAYSRLENQLVKQVKEKGSFTAQRENEFASCGAYYFKNKSLLSQALEYQVKHEIKVNGEFYTSLTVEALLQMKPDAHVRVFEIPYFYQWGTPDDLKDFEYWEKTFLSKNRFANSTTQTEQILLPMAGLGSRFKELTSKRKPFIRLNNIPMYERAIMCLPNTKKIGIVSLQELEAEVNPKYQFKGLKETPAGQALSVEEGLSLIDLDKPVLVSACDHGIVINPKSWEQFQNIEVDAAVFCIKGFPGTRRSPQSYSYVEAESSPLNSQFPKVKKIYLKKTLSDNPQNDFLLVGTFWFKSGHLLKRGINLLKESNALINNELYLDGIFDLFQKNKLNSVVFPLDGYFNWGDPESLRESLYWEEVFGGQTLNNRPRYPGVEF